MARIRTIKPEFWTNPQVTRVSFAARLLFIGTWSFADDHGNLPRDPEKLKMQVFPGDTIEVEPLLVSLIAQGLLTEYSVSAPENFGSFAERFLHIPTFTKHQLINRPSKPLYPLPDKAEQEHSLSTHGRKGKGKGTETVSVSVNTKNLKTNLSKDDNGKPRARARSSPSGLSPSRSLSRSLSSSASMPVDDAQTLTPNAVGTQQPPQAVADTIAANLRARDVRYVTRSAERIGKAVTAGATAALFDEACSVAIAEKHGLPVGANYVAGIVGNWLREGHSPHAVNGHPSSNFDSLGKERQATYKGLTGRDKRRSGVIDVPMREVSDDTKHP
ncbi:hypothetical protein [Paraburkholderia sp. MM5477-R1]|uniref:hypothetical protein n=1 Tax=Paraburkholderia sp. MM5477-R1 TaxID=2991062 RepID=UPI003D23687E